MNSTVNTKTILLSLLFGFYVSTGFSQVPGYMGKRIALGIDLNTSVWQRGQFTYGYYSEQGEFTPTLELYPQLYVMFRPTLKLEFATSRKNSIQGFFRMFSSKADAPKINIPYESIDGYTLNLTYIPRDLVQMKGLNVGIKITHYFGQQISPIGFYNSFGLEYSRMTFKTSQTNFSAYHPITKTLEYTDIQPDIGQNIIVSYTLGRQTTLKEKALINFAFEFGFPILFYIPEDGIERQNWAQVNGAKQALNHSAVNFVIGYSLPF